MTSSDIDPDRSLVLEFRVSSPVLTFSGDVGNCHFVKGVYEGPVKSGPFAYFTNQGYKVEFIDREELDEEGKPEYSELDEDQVHAVRQYLSEQEDPGRKARAHRDALAGESLPFKLVSIKTGETEPDFDPDVDPFAGRGSDELPRPAVNDDKGAWITYVVALTKGTRTPFTVESADKLTKKELINYQVEGQA